MNDSASPPASPAARLEASRARVRDALRAAAAARAGPGDTGGSAAWLDALRSIPGSGLLIDALQRWWTQHPLHVTAQVFSSALQALVRPLAQRHPIALVGGALVVGGLLAAGRPWRWILTPTLLAGLLPQLLAKAVALVPAQSWMAIVASLARQPPAEPPAPAQTAASPSAPAAPASATPPSATSPLQH
jgi:hypothetical protein